MNYKEISNNPGFYELVTNSGNDWLKFITFRSGPSFTTIMLNEIHGNIYEVPSFLQTDDNKFQKIVRNKLQLVEEFLQ